MTREELKAHCKKEIEICELWAHYKDEEPNNSKIYQEHKLILELLEKEESVLDNTIIIPKGATNGDMIKAVFPDALKSNYIESGLDMKDYVTIYIGDYEMRVAYDWWDAPYKAGVEPQESEEE